MEEIEIRTQHRSPGDRVSSSAYSSNSGAAGGQGGDSSDEGDVELSTTLHESYVSGTPSHVQHETANVSQHGTPQAARTNNSEAKGKKKLSRESFKNMGKMITESSVATKFKKHRGKKNGNTNDDVMNELNTSYTDERNGTRLETIQHTSDDDDDEVNHHVDENNMQPLTSASRTEAEPAVDSTARFLLHDVERTTEDPEMIVRERKLEESPCFSVALFGILAAGVVLGIIFCSMIPLGVAFQILGPTILGLSAFALVYKIYVTVFWKEDPYRCCVRQLKCLKRAK